MRVNGDANLGTIIPLVLFLTAQTVGAVWWAGTMTTAVEDLRIELTEFTVDQQAEQLRQWDRINSVEQTSAQAAASVKALEKLLLEMDKDISLIQGDIREVNRYLKDILTQIGAFKNGD